MAPSYQYQDITPILTYYGNEVYSNPCTSSRKLVETKKEKVKRIAKEKMHASWKTYNQKTAHIIEIKQICKPRHRRF